ncbi:tetratricopeptide repeat protein [Gilvimarinus agarilyticus]|uniref:tetratricopeptide repeat protein n=1 Tax=Gilvimarinus agarilyticus TaxID=679259 RepID=UPI000697267F|nr:tetratricopeptide repeat protein [Gilvimarinus agarilyticus]
MTCFVKNVGSLVAIVLLSGCASQMGPGSGAPVEDSDTSVRVPGMEPQAPERPRPDERPNTDAPQDERDNSGWRVVEPEPEAPVPARSNSAVDALLAQGRSEYRNGDYSRAIASAERALRIDRRNPAVYLLLAENYQRLGNRNQAEQFAQQGLRYSRDDHTVDAALRGVLSEL